MEVLRSEVNLEGHQGDCRFREDLKQAPLALRCRGRCGRRRRAQGMDRDCASPSKELRRFSSSMVVRCSMVIDKPESVTMFDDVSDA